MNAWACRIPDFPLQSPPDGADEARYLAEQNPGAPDFRSLLTALLFGLLAFSVYMMLVGRFAPRTTPATSAPAEELPPDIATTQVAGPTATSAAASSQAAGELSFSAGRDLQPVVLGGDSFPLAGQFTPVGGGLATLDLTERKKNGALVHRQDIGHKEPYRLLNPLVGTEGEIVSFKTHRIWIAEYNNRGWDLDTLAWEIAEKSDSHIVFQTALRTDGEGQDIVRLRKQFRLRTGAPIVDLELTSQNLSTQPLTITIAQDGPVGVHRDDRMYDMRKIVVAKRGENAVEVLARDRSRLVERQKLLAASDRFVWSALANKYFGAFTRVATDLQSSSIYSDAVQSVEALLAGPASNFDAAHPSDMITRWNLKPQRIEPGQASSVRFETYAGPKDPDVLKRLGSAYVARAQLGYDLASTVDATCCCSFHWLTTLMTSLLRGIYFLVRNYGIAIICLVILVRGVLHPLAVWQQKSMYRLQEGMARLQPRMAAIKEKYANDAVKQQQEQLKLFAEENVNPAAGAMSMVPMFLQLPILIALWNALNTDIEMRLAPFDGWWIRDLSSPDQLIKFASPVTIPLLGWLPLIGSAFSNIPSLNVLPIIMGVSMYLQQKYMPKPALAAKMEAAKNAPPPKGMGGMTPEEQMRQQQMVANMMAVMLPVMFYYQPSGLVLYWLATNVFGIFESMRIKKQLEIEKKRRETLGPEAFKKSGKPGVLAGFLKKLAEQAEEIQRKADDFSDGKKK